MPLRLYSEAWGVSVLPDTDVQLLGSSADLKKPAPLDGPGPCQSLVGPLGGFLEQKRLPPVGCVPKHP